MLESRATVTHLHVIPFDDHENRSICPEDDLRLECTARNSSIIEWSSNNNFYFTYCQKNDPPVRNDTIGATQIITVKTNYSDETSDSTLICSLDIQARALPTNQQLTFTCLNVDIGIRASASFEVAGILTLY